MFSEGKVSLAASILRLAQKSNCFLCWEKRKFSFCLFWQRLHKNAALKPICFLSLELRSFFLVLFKRYSIRSPFFVPISRL